MTQKPLINNVFFIEMTAGRYSAHAVVAGSNDQDAINLVAQDWSQSKLSGERLVIDGIAYLPAMSGERGVLKLSVFQTDA